MEKHHMSKVTLNHKLVYFFNQGQWGFWVNSTQWNFKLGKQYFLLKVNGHEEYFFFPPNFGILLDFEGNFKYTG